uniref:Uncharacterized protein n=1 Tax=Anguilla anguilla TaxID=7936 RepID=A0A0E9TXE6_ANGAN
MYLPYLFTHVHIAPSSSVPKYISLTPESSTKLRSNNITYCQNLTKWLALCNVKFKIS